ncbi:hypothetical protein LXL04_009006 [Taraxacum kok-saghyz]
MQLFFNGSMNSLEEYCQKLKDLSDQLTDVESPVSQNRLVLQLVRGLPPEYDTTAAYINQTLPDWDTAQSMLQLERNRQQTREQLSSTSVGLTATSNEANIASDSSSRQPRPNRDNRGPLPTATIVVIAISAHHTPTLITNAALDLPIPLNHRSPQIITCPHGGL